MKKRSHWEIKSTLSELAYKQFAVWCVEHNRSMSDVMRAVVVAAGIDDRRLSAIVKEYDTEVAKP